MKAATTTQENNTMSKTFGTNVDKLFERGPVSIADLFQANAKDITALEYELESAGIYVLVDGNPGWVSHSRPTGPVTISEKERLHNIQRAEKYKLDRFELDKAPSRSFDTVKDDKPSI